MVHLECKDGGHFKFWAAAVSGRVLTVRFGRIGTDGQTKLKKFANAEAAQRELEKLIREKVGKGYAQTKGKATRPSGGLTDFTALLAPKSKAVAARVALASEDPAAYAKKYAEALEDRNAEDDPVDPWLALVTALTDERIKLACSFDWKESAEEIAAGLGNVIAAHRKLRGSVIPEPKTVLGFYDEDEHFELKTLDFIKLCGRALSAHGLALVELELGSDSYELTVLPWKDVAAGQAFAKRAGGGLILHGPKTPLSAPLARVQQAAPSKVKLERRRVPWVTQPIFFEAPVLFHNKNGTSFSDCRVWPPARRQLTKKGYFECALHDDGSFLLHRLDYELDENEEFGPRPTGTLRIERPKRPPLDLLAQVPDHFTIGFATWMGDWAVLMPDESNETSGRPLVWDGRTLAPARGLPDARNARSWLSGKARTGEGTEVLLWEGAGWVVDGDRFVRRWTLPSNIDSSHGLVMGAAAQGNGFFFVQHDLKKGRLGETSTLWLAEAGKARPRVSLPRVDAPPRTAPDGRVVLGLNRHVGKKKDQLLAVFHPQTDEVTIVPKAMLGFKKDAQAYTYGVSEAKGGAFLWVLDDSEVFEVRRLPWAAILALPRAKAQ